MQPNPSESSYYVGAGFYGDLIAAFTGWQDEAAEVTDTETRESCRRFLEREARFLEQDRHEDWLGLYAPECLYWVPASPGGGDPRREVAVAFDDRRRLETEIRDGSSRRRHRVWIPEIGPLSGFQPSRDPVRGTGWSRLDRCDQRPLAFSGWAL